MALSQFMLERVNSKMSNEVGTKFNSKRFELFARWSFFKRFKIWGKLERFMKGESSVES